MTPRRSILALVRAALLRLLVGALLVPLAGYLFICLWDRGLITYTMTVLPVWAGGIGGGL